MSLDAVNAAQVSKNEPTFSDVEGWTGYFADLTYDATDAVYSDSTGVTTQSTDVNSTEGAPLSDANTDNAQRAWLASVAPTLVHTSTTINIRLHGLANTYARHRITLFKVQDADIYPGMQGSYNTADLGKTTRVHGSECTMLAKHN